MSIKEYLYDQDSLLSGLATGFGAGIGGKGRICGALTGAVIVIGMKFGRTDPKDVDSELKVNVKCRQFWDQFEKEFGSNLCYDIFQYRLDKKEERQKWLASGGMEKCADIVEKTA